MAKKRLTVGRSPHDQYGDAFTPYLRFGGKWLKNCGIEIGDRIEVIPGENSILLLKISESDIS